MWKYSVLSTTGDAIECEILSLPRLPGYARLALLVFSACYGFHQLTLDTGAPFQWAAIFHKSDMTFANGSCGLEFYSSLNQSSEYGTPTKVSCCHCRTPIMDEGRRVCLLFPTLIDLSGWDNETMERRKAFEARYAAHVEREVCRAFAPRAGS